MNHTTLLNYLIDKYGLKSYLEIGVRSTEQNFDKINCQVKYGVDPLQIASYIIQTTSDLFFDWNEKTFDLIFLDGLHHAYQVERDFNNSLRCLNDNGFIVIHDCLPTEEITTCVPRDSKEWHGDVWKFVWKLREYNNINFVTFDMDNGCTVAWKEKRQYGSVSIHNIGTTWQDYLEHRNDVFNIKSPSDIDKYLP